MSNLSYMMSVCAAFAYGAAAFVVEVAAFSVLAVFKAVINGAQAILGWVDDLADSFVPDLALADNALARAAILAVVGFLVWLILTLLLSVMTGLWVIPCSLAIFIGERPSSASSPIRSARSTLVAGPPSRTITDPRCPSTYEGERECHKFWKSDTSLVLGTIGMGKSYWTLYKIVQSLLHEYPCCYIDPKGDTYRNLLTFFGFSKQGQELWQATATGSSWSTRSPLPTTSSASTPYSPPVALSSPTVTQWRCWPIRSPRTFGGRRALRRAKPCGCRRY